MKRFLIAMVIPALMVGPVAATGAEGSTNGERTVRASYYGPQFDVAGIYGSNRLDDFEERRCVRSGFAGCVTLETGANEGTLTAIVRDALGTQVSVWVTAAPASSVDMSNPKVYGAFCGETTQPISFDPGTKLELWIGSYWWPLQMWGPRGLSCNAGPATTGTIEITLSD